MLAARRAMEKARVAVIGAGPSGLSMLKQLREDGFKVTLYERRNRVGGLWAYTENPAYTTALPITRANLSKFTCGFSDFPIPDKYQIYMQPHEFQEYMESYAHHFDLLKDIVFEATVSKVRRSDANDSWLIDVADKKNGKTETAEFDRVAFCNGYQTKAEVPTFEGQDKFAGTIMHSQAYRDASQFKDKKVVVVGLSSSSGDVIPDLMPVASKVYVSHRRGAVPFKRYRNGVPNDISLTWRRRQISQFLQKHFPSLARWAADAAIAWIARRAFGKLDPAWRLEPFPSITLNVPGSFELVMPFLKDGSLTSLHGLTRFTGQRSIEFADGTVIDDVDAVILCTGYSADWSAAAPFMETSRPTPIKTYGGPDMHRLYMNLFPPQYADSCVMLCYSAFGKNNGWSFADVTAWAVSNVWRGVGPLPPREEMEKHIDAHQKWVAEKWDLDHYCDVSMVKQWEFQQWLHKAAGTGMENLGWGWKGWLFWLKDRKMYNLMNDGVETAHAYRYFETGKRRTWDGARDAIIHLNEAIKMTFPLKEIPWPPEPKA
ncbi:flavin-containing monooxygenase 9 [Diplogelasinospora grovesii]|uniref:Flavin-containing monooxygenase 9 n=1 Tax=Diplogelasinospora grovesii TaxID=303347 RepID=A0AAN6ND98_9PEZI|nr:flavin-containing monooxygenase 9 [Diplogelasinospora grovesii]